jgi:hypothetical protein
MEYVSCRKQVAVAPENASFTGGHRTTLRPSHQAVEAQAGNERWRCYREWFGEWLAGSFGPVQSMLHIQ